MLFKLDCDSKSYPIRRVAYGRIPLDIAPADSSLDKLESRYSITNGRKSVSAFQLVQQYLSASGPANWGRVTRLLGKTIMAVKMQKCYIRNLSRETTMTTITYEFRGSYLTPNPNELEKRLVTITSEGNIFVSHYNGRRLILKKKPNLSPELEIQTF